MSGGLLIVIAVLKSIHDWIRSKTEAMNKTLEGKFSQYIRQPEYEKKMGFLYEVDEDIRRVFHLLIDKKGSDSGYFLAIYECPLNGGCSPISGEQRSVQINRSPGRHLEYNGGQYSKSHHDETVRIPLAESIDKCRFFEILRLQQGYIVLNSSLLNR